MSSNEAILTISVAAKLLHLHPRTLMLYEREHLTSPHRTTTQRRMFSLADLDHLQFVIYLIQVKGLNIQGVKTMLEAIETASKGNVDLKRSMFPDFKSKSLI
jgi:MerR family transcriptional regulator/heat shock protein HspR